MSAYSSTISFSHARSLAMAAYNSLYARWMTRASLKQLRGNRLGNKVTGAVVASDPDGLISGGMKVGGGLTAKPLRIDQFFIFESRNSCWSFVA